ncbi:QWRF motif-containing protein 2-like [Abrus precatorius]|uniref:QWRF motif-containing protein 2-like n=1 Tax=Abrus precatorius TaxID=3816 RepID=A0A8B8LNH5_ABRPR|nr:QWRF motif-containing protein 2-like [Abrus precatorius]
MVAVISTPSQPENSFTPRTPKPRQATSSSCHSPLSSKRSESVERNRPRSGATEMTPSGKMLLTSTTTRSLSVSFQGESFWITVSKSKPINAPPPKLAVPRKSPFDTSSSPRAVLNSRGQVSFSRPPSPNKLPTVASSSRGVSPSRLRNGASPTLNNASTSNQPSILSFAVDVKRGRIGENRIVDGHSLRLLYNRLLQWRFVNARADTDLSLQKFNAENCLYDASASTCKLRESVCAKRRELQLLKLQFKLTSILREQMMYLEDWGTLDSVYSGSLSGAIQALKASTFRLPVVDVAKAHGLKVKDAICSAVDVMRAMATSLCLLSPKIRVRATTKFWFQNLVKLELRYFEYLPSKGLDIGNIVMPWALWLSVGHVNSLVVEVANLSAKEHVLLDECKDLLSKVKAMQVNFVSKRGSEA